jgi:hypothetical protein
VSNHPEVSTPGLHDMIGSIPRLVPVPYDFGRVENLVLTFEGSMFSKVMGNHLPDSGILGRTILVTFHFDLPGS